MSQRLEAPLERLLELIVAAMNAGIARGAFNGGDEHSYNWPALFERQRDQAVAHLRHGLEQRTRGGRTLRVAAASLHPEETEGILVLALVTCRAPRAEGAVVRLERGDVLSILVAPTPPSLGVYYRRLEQKP